MTGGFGERKQKIAIEPCGFKGGMHFIAVNALKSPHSTYLLGKLAPRPTLLDAQGHFHAIEGTYEKIKDVGCWKKRIAKAKESANPSRELEKVTKKFNNYLDDVSYHTRRIQELLESHEDHSFRTLSDEIKPGHIFTKIPQDAHPITWHDEPHIERAIVESSPIGDKETFDAATLVSNELAKELGIVAKGVKRRADEAIRRDGRI